MKHPVLCFFLLPILLTLSCNAQEGSQNRGSGLLKEKTDLLIKHPDILGYFDVSETGIRMYSSPEDKSRGIVECMIHPGEYESFGRLYHHLNVETIQKLYLA